MLTARYEVDSSDKGVGVIGPRMEGAPRGLMRAHQAGLSASSGQQLVCSPSHTDAEFRPHVSVVLDSRMLPDNLDLT